MNKDSGVRVNTLKVDGGMTSNNLLMQLQADLVGIDVGMYVLCVCVCVCEFSLMWSDIVLRVCWRLCGPHIWFILLHAPLS